MTDYLKDTGTTAKMMIRDTGSVVEMWINAFNNTTWNADLDYGWTVNGVTGSSSVYYAPGAGWVKLKSFTVTTTQTVTFRLPASGTSGFGGPTTLSAVITRGAAPAAPSRPSISGLGAFGATISFTDGSNNYLAIDSRQISYGLTNTASTTVVASDGSTAISGLSAGKTYYVKARTHNSKGYSPWSAVASFTTLNVPPAPSQVKLSEVTQSTLKAVFTSNGTGGTAVLEWQLAYGTNPVTPSIFVKSTGTSMVTGLAPGERYYFWARGRNAIGWGPWSTTASVTMVAGIRWKAGDKWVTAVPYVNVDGVWKVALPRVKIAGMWKPTG